MATVKVKCPYGGSEEVVLYGKSWTGKQRLLCRNPACSHKIFQLEYANNACKPGTKEKIVEMAMNGADVRDTGRVLDISPNTVTAVKKTVNEEYFKKLETKQETDIVINNALAAEIDEMWSFYHDKSHQIWLWWAADHKTSTPPACTFGTREHKYLDELLANVMGTFP